MTTTVEPTVEWSQDQMVEVILNEPERRKNCINLAIFFISKVDTLSFTLRNCLHLMVNMQTLPLMTFSVATALPAYLLIGD
jgi:hypothetical protein